MYANLRVGGLVSGLDINQLVSDLMKIERMRVDKLEQEKQILAWQQEDYRALNNSLRSLRDAAFNMKLQGFYLAKCAASSNPDVVLASAGPSAKEGVYNVTVAQLAEGILKSSQEELSAAKKGDGSTKTLTEQFGLSGTINFTLEGKNGSHDFSFTASVDSIFDVTSAINAARLGITASYDTALNRFFLTTDSTGSDQRIVVTGDEKNFLSDSVGDGSANTLKLKLKTEEVYTGQDACFQFGDAQFTSKTNTAAVNGITLNLKQGGGVTSTITITKDIDAVYNNIANFVNTYNETIEAIYGKLTETRYADYLPLTDTQREQLTDAQIEKWEEKAKSGLLRNEPLLYKIASKLRSTASTNVLDVESIEGYSSLSAIGITTTVDYRSAKLEVNEAKLRAALNNDLEGVMNLFTKSSENYDGQGIAQRLYSDAGEGMRQIINKAGGDFSLYDNSTIGRQILTINSEINNLNDHLQKIEDRYWRQFAALERALQQMNAQSTWLAQQFGLYQTY